MAGHLLDTNTLALWRMDELNNSQPNLTVWQQASGLSKQPIMDGVDDTIIMGDFLSFERNQSFSISCWFTTLAAIPGHTFLKAKTSLGKTLSLVKLCNKGLYRWYSRIP